MLADINIDFSPIPKDKSFEGLEEGDDLSYGKKIDWLENIIEIIEIIRPEFEALTLYVNVLEEDEDNRSRLSESIETALGLSNGLVEIEVIDPIAEKPFIADVVPFKNGTSIMGLTPEETLDRIQNKPDVCLVSSMFSMEWPITQILIDQVKAVYPECVIIGGGEHFSAAAKISLDTSALDICVLGEGEATIRELVERMLAGERIPLDVPGTMVKDPNTQRIIGNEARDRIREVRVIPYPAWEYFNVDGFLDEGVSNTGSGLVDFRAMPIVASRGCPYQCTFCSNPSMWGNLWKARPPQDVVNELGLHYEDVLSNNEDKFSIETYNNIIN